jgi:ATP-dependent DNA helicase RecG
MTDLESDRVERKAALTDKDKVRQAICAFANDLPDHRQPGVIFIGVDDAAGKPTNLPITDELLRTLSDMRSDGNTLPFPMMTVQKRMLCGSDVAVIEVLPSYNPPVRFGGRVWVRVGPRRATATAEEERRLSEKRRAGDLPFDQQPAQGASLEDLDLGRFEREYLPFAVAADVLAENHRPLQQKLQSLRFLTKEGEPNNASVLVLGKDPRRWIPGAYVQFLRIDGTELTDPLVNQREISGTILDIIRQTEEVLTANVSVATDVTAGLTEERKPDYPIVALQQLLRNAVLHRTYETTNAPIRVYWFSDRIEIFNPGVL